MIPPWALSDAAHPERELEWRALLDRAERAERDLDHVAMLLFREEQEPGGWSTNREDAFEALGTDLLAKVDAFATAISGHREG